MERHGERELKLRPGADPSRQVFRGHGFPTACSTSHGAQPVRRPARIRGRRIKVVAMGARKQGNVALA